MLIPFISLGIGFSLGFLNLSGSTIRKAENITSAALILLMFTIGASIGSNSALMSELAYIGIECSVIALISIALSVLLVYLLERSILPLEEISIRLNTENVKFCSFESKENTYNKNRAVDPLVLLIALSVIMGIILGRFILPESFLQLSGHLLTASLVILYIGVGISQSANRIVFKYLKTVGFKMLLLPLAVFIGSVCAGFISGYVLKLPYRITVMSASGMSYYSITGAYISQIYGAETGAYGFMVNVMREIFTVLLLPVLVKISKGSPIASGAAGNMDTMLAPVTKFVGAEYGIITLITGVVLTLAVPVILPVLHSIFSCF